jgi:hypothetical protein
MRKRFEQVALRVQTVKREFPEREAEALGRLPHQLRPRRE